MIYMCTFFPVFHCCIVSSLIFKLCDNRPLIDEITCDFILQGAFEQRFVQSAESPALAMQEISKQIVEATMLLKDIPALEYLWRRAHGQANALLLDIHEFSSAQEKHSEGDSILL